MAPDGTCATAPHQPREPVGKQAADPVARPHFAAGRCWEDEAVPISPQRSQPRALLAGGCAASPEPAAAAEPRRAAPASKPQTTEHNGRACDGCHGVRKFKGHCAALRKFKYICTGSSGLHSW